MDYLSNLISSAVAQSKPNKDIFCILGGVIGSTITYLFGGWSRGLETLLFFIIVDYVTGIIAAGVFKNSSKTKKGGLSSAVGYKGLISKVGILIAVACLHKVDSLMNKDIFMNAAIIGFCANEFISIIENLGKWGIKFPPIVTKAIECLNTKAKEVGEK